jgi:hypothetical protein
MTLLNERMMGVVDRGAVRGRAAEASIGENRKNSVRRSSYRPRREASDIIERRP